MKKFLLAIITFGTFLSLTSCMSSYNVQGSSNISSLDGKMLYLKTLKGEELTNLDSCDVVHGQFHFHGSVDTTRMANIFMDDEHLLPIVIENGDINVRVDDTRMEVSGTPLNEKLFGFLKDYNSIVAEMDDLTHRHDQAIMEGLDMEKVIEQLNEESVILSARQDSLLTSFVTENFDNVLGPGVFMLVTVAYPFPQFNAWIDDILSKATDKFKNDPYVKEYCQRAKENQEIMNGMRETQAQHMPQSFAEPAEAAPTPNELAQPAE